MSELRDRSQRSPKPSAVARHGRLSRSRVWKTVLGLIGGIVAVVLVAGVSVVAIAGYRLQAQVQTVAIAADTAGPPPNIAAIDGGFNILLVGSDTRAGQGGIGGTEAQAGGTLNDVTMLMHVAQDQKSATVVTFPRDMVVPLPRCSNGGPAQGQPINTTLYYGGLPCTVLTVQALTGLDIQFAGLITFTGVIAMSDAVGGVDVCTTSAIHDPYTGLNIDAAGVHTISGYDALAFLRSRHGVGDGSDLGRIGSQQVYLSSLVRKIKDDGTLSDLSKLYKIAQAATQNITLSQNFQHLDTLVSVALVLKNIPLANIVFVQYPSRTGVGGIYQGKVAPIASQATALFDAIKADKPVGLDANSLTGAHGGSTLANGTDNTPTATKTPVAIPYNPSGYTAAPSATPTPTVAPTIAPSPTTAPVVVSGVKGQTAAMQTCSVGN